MECEAKGSWVIDYSSEDIRGYMERKIKWINENTVSQQTWNVYTIAMKGLEEVTNSWPEAPMPVMAKIDKLQDSLREAASQKAEEALEEINQRVLSVSSVIPSRKGVMMNGGQAIGYVNAKDIAGADCETT